MADRCGVCKYFRDFKKDKDGYWQSPHCLIWITNYYSPDDKSSKPRKSYLSITADNPACTKFARKQVKSIDRDLIDLEAVPF